MYFDTTGSIIPNITDQKICYLYSLVSSNLKTKTNLPTFDILTTQHCATSLTKRLGVLRDLFDDYNSRTSNYLYPSIVVVDCAWAMIHTVNKTFNSCNILTYLNWSFDLIVMCMCVQFIY